MKQLIFHNFPLIFCRFESILDFLRIKKLNEFKKFIKCLQSYKIYAVVILKYRGILLWG